ncbi:heterokaryon incompatibility protein-domain-containing protein [Neurospora hispaniola]|uniref:Heterokaryon incompatibility protein-domain-containing protein n=1 Tax=Neurospora hispaniola TaxID=588809 RepID=A0AAJ0II12_9PEZI|nr:heterokaryon incompatibility protein-domain-containing protein [Neurospora hispaniola]
MSTVALDLNHNTTTSAPHALALAEVSSSDNPADLKSRSDDHVHKLAKDNNPTDQHLDSYQGATGDNLCSVCNDIKDIFDFESGIPARSWHTLDLLARFDIPLHEDFSSEVSPSKVWKIIPQTLSQTCPFCSFLVDCASRMAIHTAVDLKSNDGSLALCAVDLNYCVGKASCGRYKDLSRTQVLQLQLRSWQGWKTEYHVGLENWEDTRLILPVQTYNDGHDKVTSTMDWELIKKWLDTCRSEHDYNCHADLATTALENIPSFCLIDCESETIILAAERCSPKYVTLSYVWGASITSPPVLDANTSLPVLPNSNQRLKVVNDAMETVRRIGYRYLWVDRYCIPQSDHDAKSIQIKNMGKIYSLSVLTIIAAAGNDAEYGLPGVSSPPTLQPVWTTIRSGKRDMPLIYFEAPNKDISRSTWNSRGWTYQEALLPKRRLVFTDRQVYFQCESMQSIGHLDHWIDLDRWPITSSRSGVFPFLKHLLYNVEVPSLQEESIWKRIHDYEKRILSYEEDTINAVQGILESFRNICDVWFFYGLPVMDSSSSDFGNSQNDSTVSDFWPHPVGTVHVREIASGMQAILSSLFWRDCWRYFFIPRDSTHETKLSDQAKTRRKGFPSWTWAGWETAKYRVVIEAQHAPAHRAKYYLYVPEGFLFEIRVSYDKQCLTWSRDNQEIRRRAENNDQCPNFLIISGPVFDVSITCTRPPFWVYTSPRFLATKLFGGPPCLVINGVREGTIGLVALCVFSMYEDRSYLHALILRPAEKDAQGQIYERLTCARFRSTEFEPHFSIKDLNLRQMELRIR